MMYLPNKVYITLILHFIDLEILWGNIMGSTPSGKQILIANIVKTSINLATGKHKNMVIFRLCSEQPPIQNHPDFLRVTVLATIQI